MKLLDNDFAKAMNWVKRNHENYQGFWVALKDGLLIESDTRLANLRSKINFNVDCIIIRIPKYKRDKDFNINV